jgi:uncharacterized protein YndB with AHSA1/START domain
MMCNLTVTPAEEAPVPDRIEKDVLIAAPVERVWELITRAEHLGRWFGDAGAEVDLRPGGELVLRWGDHGAVRGRIVAIEPPRRFAYRWLVAFRDEAEPTPANSTLTEFTLTAEGGGTRVAVVESGFDALDLPDAERTERFADHTTGWPIELGHLVAHADHVPAAR